jgi:antitoxin CcdA
MIAATRRVPTNLSVPPELVRKAKALGLNLSEVFEAALEEAIRRKEQEAWLNDNREAIGAYNTKVEHEGVFSDDWRSF